MWMGVFLVAGFFAVGHADLSYTISMQIEDEQHGSQNITQYCRTQNEFLLTETSYSVEKGNMVQLIDMKRGIIYDIDHKQRRVTMSPIPDEDIPEVLFVVEELDTTTIRGLVCKGYRIHETQQGVPSATMEVYVTDSFSLPFDSMWKGLLKEKSKAQRKLRDQIKGFPVRYMRTSFLQDKTRIQMEVTDIQDTQLPGQIFTIPEDYTLQVSETVGAEQPEEL